MIIATHAITYRLDKQSIVIKASSGLSDDEVERMIKDAEAHADEDRKLAELVHARNHADGLIHATEKSLKDLGDKVHADEKSHIEAAIAAAKEAVKGDNKADIETKTEALTELSGKLAERVYAQEGSAEAEHSHAGDSHAQQADDGVIDADFEEVKK
jgi:molecular chaperone DnaK